MRLIHGAAMLRTLLTCCVYLSWTTLAGPIDRQTPSLVGRQKRSLPFAYGAEKVRGVNLGGWLVLEPWIRPSLFQQFEGSPNPAVDEYTFCQYLGYDAAAGQLAAHWATWYTESDFVNLAAWGINHVRIPVGYWAFDVAPGEPWVMGAEAYLRQALVWATNHGLKVWIDLHGAPGSQNGGSISFPFFHRGDVFSELTRDRVRQ